MDANIYDHAVKNAWAGTIGPIAKDGHSVVCTSVEVLIEVMRCEDDGLRRKLVKAVLGATHHHLVPALARLSDEVIREIGRHHPEWLRMPADTSATDLARKRAQTLWRTLSGDPGYRPTGLVQGAAFLARTLKEGKEGQKARRRVVRDGGQPDLVEMLGTSRADLGAEVLAMRPSERHWRVLGGALLWDALGGDPALVDMKTWFEGRIRPLEELKRDAWLRFWCRDAQPPAIPTYLIYLLAELHQTDLGVQLHTSNALDAIHASYLLDVDAIITRDSNFVKVLEATRSELPTGFGAVVEYDESGGQYADTFRSILESLRPKSH